MFACMFHVCLDCFTFREGKWNIHNISTLAQKASHVIHLWFWKYNSWVGEKVSNIGEWGLLYPVFITVLVVFCFKDSIVFIACRVCCCCFWWWWWCVCVHVCVVGWLLIFASSKVVTHYLWFFHPVLLLGGPPPPPHHHHHPTPRRSDNITFWWLNTNISNNRERIS